MVIENLNQCFLLSFFQDEPESKSEWSVLRDDFMMSTKLKDWDKDENEEKDENV